MNSTMQTLLNKVHLRYQKDTDYPDPTSEDFAIMLAYADDGITMWEKEAQEGVPFKILIKQNNSVPTGTGTDPEPDDFLNFLRAEDKPAIITDGKSEWREVSSGDGNRMVQDGNAPQVFWREAGNIRTLPAISGSMRFPYIRKATRYPLGTESIPIEISDEMFLQEYVIAMLYLDDDNLTEYQAHMNNAKDILLTMKGKSLSEPADDSDWGFGM